MTEEEFRAIAMSFPGVETGFNMKSTFFKVNGKDLARLLGDDNIMLTGVGPDEIDHLIESDPAAFHATQHFRDAKCIAARLESLIQRCCGRCWRAAFDNWRRSRS